jgi:DNA-binding protein HU-beta
MVSKSQLAQRIAARGATPAQAAHAVDAVLGEITAALAAGEKVTFVGFGTFEPVARGARTARNPRTGETVPVAAATVPRFHPGAGLRTAVDGGGASLGAVGSLADGYASLVVPEAPATVAKPVKAAKPAKPAKAAKAAPAKPAKPAQAKAAKAAKPPAKDDKRKGKDAKGKKQAKKK